MAERQDEVEAAADNKCQQDIEAVAGKDACRKWTGEDKGLREQHADDEADDPTDDTIVVDLVIDWVRQQLLAVALLTAQHQIIDEEDGRPGSQQLADDAEEAFQGPLKILCNEEDDCRDDRDDNRLEQENQLIIPDEMCCLEDELRGLEAKEALRRQTADGCDVIDDGEIRRQGAFDDFNRIGRLREVGDLCREQDTNAEHENQRDGTAERDGPGNLAARVFRVLMAAVVCGIACPANACTGCDEGQRWQEIAEPVTAWHCREHGPIRLRNDDHENDERQESEQIRADGLHADQHLMAEQHGDQD